MITNMRCGPVAWSYSAIATVPRDMIGVYAFRFRKTGKYVYVGKAEDRPLKKRLHDHWRKSHNETLQLWIKVFGDQLDICYASVALEQRNRIGTLERRLIRLWSPEANSQHKS